MSRAVTYRIDWKKLRDLRERKFFLNKSEFCKEITKRTWVKLDISSLARLENWERNPWPKVLKWILNWFKLRWEDIWLQFRD